MPDKDPSRVHESENTPKQTYSSHSSTVETIEANTTQTIQQMLDSFDRGEASDLLRLEKTFSLLQELTFSSRERLETVLQTIQGDLLNKAWQQTSPLIFSDMAKQLTLNFSALPETPDPTLFRLSDTPGVYEVARPATVDDLYLFIQALLKTRFLNSDPISSPQDMKDFLITELALCEKEVFAAIFMNAQHQVIAFEKLFYGTIDSASVYPREVMKQVLHHNAAAIIFAHNHPSGLPTPSDADKQITQKLKEALGTIEIRVLDHIIVGGVETLSFAEEGFI